MQSFAADPVYVKDEVFAYVGLSQNLKDLKDGVNQHTRGVRYSLFFTELLDP